MKKSLEKILNLPVFLFLLTFLGFAGPALSYNKLYLYHLFLIFSCISLFMVRRDFFLGTCKKLLPILGIYLLSLLWSINIINSVNYVIILVIGVLTIAIFASIPITNKQSAVIDKAILCFWIINLALGLVEMTTDFRYPISHFSQVNHWFGISHLFTEYDSVKLAWAQPTGLMWNVNGYCTLLVALCFYSISMKLKRILRVVLVLVTIFIIIFIQSKSCTFSLFLTIIVFLGLKAYATKNWSKFLIQTFLALTCFIIIIKLHPPLEIQLSKFWWVLNRNFIGGLPVDINESTTIRFNMYRDAWASVKENFLLGQGAFASSSPIVLKSFKKPMSLHFFPLEVLVDVGMMGFIIVFGGITRLFILMIKRVKNPYFSKIRIGHICTLFSLLICAQSLSSVIYYLPFYIFIGLFLRKEHALRDAT